MLNGIIERRKVFYFLRGNTFQMCKKTCARPTHLVGRFHRFGVILCASNIFFWKLWCSFLFLSLRKFGLLSHTRTHTTHKSDALLCCKLFVFCFFGKCIMLETREMVTFYLKCHVRMWVLRDFSSTHIWSEDPSLSISRCVGLSWFPKRLVNLVFIIVCVCV